MAQGGGYLIIKRQPCRRSQWGETASDASVFSPPHTHTHPRKATESTELNLFFYFELKTKLNTSKKRKAELLLPCKKQYCYHHLVMMSTFGILPQVCCHLQKMTYILLCLHPVCNLTVLKYQLIHSKVILGSPCNVKDVGNLFLTRCVRVTIFCLISNHLRLLFCILKQPDLLLYTQTGAITEMWSLCKHRGNQ